MNKESFMNHTPPYMPQEPSLNEASLSYMSAARHAYNRVGLGMLVFILVPQLISLVLSVIAILAFPAFYQSVWYLWFNQIFCIYVISAPLALLVIGLPPKGMGQFEKKRMSLPQLLAVFCIMETISVVGSIISNALMQTVSAITGGDYSSPINEIMDGAPWWILFLVVGIIGPIVEELICRQAIMRRLLPFGEKSAIIFSAILFGLMHGNFYQLFYAVGLGLVLGYVYTRTNNVLYPCLLHVIFNSLSCLQSIVLSAVDFNTLEESTDLAAQMEWISANLLPYLGMLAFTFLIYGLAIAGFVLLLVYYNRLSFYTCPCPLPQEKRFSIWLGNPGMILYLVASALLIGLTLLPL
jgi:membrane protease YdiL (CAAX protease family)